MAPPANTTLLRSPATLSSALGSSLNSTPANAPKVSPLTPRGKAAELLPVPTNTSEKSAVKPNAFANIDRIANNADKSRVKVVKPGLMGIVALPGEFTALRAPVAMTGDWPPSPSARAAPATWPRALRLQWIPSRRPSPPPKRLAT